MASEGRLSQTQRLAKCWQFAVDAQCLNCPFVTWGLSIPAVIRQSAFVTEFELESLTKVSETRVRLLAKHTTPQFPSALCSPKQYLIHF